MSLTILLTGGLGYIGSNISVLLLKRGYNVIIIDNLSNSNISRLDDIEKITNKLPIFYKIDLLYDINILNFIFNKHKIDVVIHLAGLKSVNESLSNPLLYYNNNIISTLNLLTAMQNHNCSNLIFSSSATVYGSQSPPFTEKTPTGVGITNPYGKTKFLIEEILKDLNINVVILRYFNPIGSDETGILSDSPIGIPNNLFPYILKVHNNTLPYLTVFGNTYPTPDGTCLRDFINIIDLAEGHIKSIDYILNNKGVNIFNLGTGSPVSVLTLIKTFESINNTKINHIIGEPRDGDVIISYADVSKAKNILNWQTTKSIEDSVKLYK